MSQHGGPKVVERTQVDHNNSAGVGRERSEGVGGYSIQAIGRGSHVAAGVGQLARMWEWRARGAHCPGNR